MNTPNYIREAKVRPVKNRLYPNLSESADRVGGQLRGGKECPFSGLTKSGRVWRKVPEIDARSVSPSVVRCETRDAVVTQRTGPGSPTSAVDLDERFLP